MPLAASLVRLLSSAPALVACASASLGVTLLTMARYLMWIDFPWTSYRDVELRTRDLVLAAALAVASHLVPHFWRRRAARAAVRRARTEVVFGAPRGYRAAPHSEQRIVNVGVVARMARLVRQRSTAWGVACGLAIAFVGDGQPFCGPPQHDCCCCCCGGDAWDMGLYLALAWLVVTSHLVTSWSARGRRHGSGASVTSSMRTS